jgi:hypothetical protein
MASAQQPAGGGGFKGGQLEAPTPARREVNQWSVIVRTPNEVAAQTPNNLPAAKAAIKAAIDQKLMDKVLKWYIYRLTYEDLHEGRVDEAEVRRDSIAATMNEHMNELLGERGASNSRRILPTAPSPVPSPWVTPQLATPLTPDQLYVQELNNYLLEELRPTCMKYLKEVLENENRIARLQAVRVLNHFAAFGQDAVANELLNVMGNPQEHDAIKYHAVVGLDKLFEAAAAKDSKTFKGDKGVETYRKCAAAVLAFLDKHTKHDPAKQGLMPEADQRAISFIRQAAIQALGETRRALVVDGAELGQASGRDGPVAELLVKIVANQENTVQPPPTWTERVIAAKALCKMDARLSPSYQPDYAAFVLARFLVEMANASREGDREMWKLFASELKGGVETMVATLPKEGPATTYVQQSLLANMNAVLEHIYDLSKEAGSPATLSRTLENQKPTAKEVYKPVAK